MRASTKFPIAIHALLYICNRTELAASAATSEQIAASTGVNAVTIRNLFIALKSNGIITASAGKNGGVTLAANPADITLWDVYQAVEGQHLIFPFHANANAQCAIGRHIEAVLKPHCQQANDAMRRQLASVSLQMLTNELVNHCEKPMDLK